MVEQKHAWFQNYLNLWVEITVHILKSLQTRDVIAFYFKQQLNV